MDIDQIIYKIATWGIPVLFAITLHEFAHGWVANKRGDSTAKMLGRLTMNPVKHIDPIGTVLVPLIFLLLPGSLLFGWAKPIPVNTRNLKKPREDMIYIAIAGPLSNLLMAIMWFLLMHFIHSTISDPALHKGFLDMTTAGVVFNLILMILNLFPIPPLDGGKVLSNLLPLKMSLALDKIEPYGFFIVLGLIYMGVLNAVLSPIIRAVFNTIM